ncbi:androglobin-like [Maniola jurtina]|uniref:androglobin-like n=1 Tax=Maniola jurtina TaxID=191418 RepID=UPI001E68D686|nr:androglobin-like [Maniola jurtina]
MSKKDNGKRKVPIQIDPTECPFREFRDNELSPEFWGMGPAAFRAVHFGSTISKVAVKGGGDYVWVDEQTQPLPRSARQYLHGWVRAEELAMRRWNAETLVFEETGDGKMSVVDIQLSHTQVLLRSSFCRKVLCICYVLERVEGLVVEHQWENFVATIQPEGWRVRYHIYSPGLKPGGGQQHRPTLSKNGCYLVRLFYLGAWRCVWVSDLVPVDATDSPLLPFSPLLCQPPTKPGTKQSRVTVISKFVHLWPLLLCKALLKLAAPDMNSDEDTNLEDEPMPEFDVFHALTGAVNITYTFKDPDRVWNLLTSEVPIFSWDDDDESPTSTVKSKSIKKQPTKETAAVRRGSMTTILIEDTKNFPSYALPGITPGHEMSMLVLMARDLPLKKPLPEPDVQLWKTFRWVDWARRHGLYEAFDCPRTRFLKVNGLMKLSYAPHLLDVQSTESITYQFREEHDKPNQPPKKTVKELAAMATSATGQQLQKDELRQWVLYGPLQGSIKNISITYYPSMYQFASIASNPPSRISKVPQSKMVDVPAPKSAPLYLQIDGPNENVLRISLAMLHPRVLFNCGVPILDFIEPAYLILEVFEWFVDCELPVAKAYVETREYNSVEIVLPPGRHFCRIWVHSRMNWHAMFLSESSLLLGTRDVVQCAAVRECPWASRFLSNLGTAFSNWIRVNKSSLNMAANEKDFLKAYQPDLEWDAKVVGYDKALIHWMFKQALQSLLSKRLSPNEFRAVCTVLRSHFCDPDFGMPPKPKPPKSLRAVADMDPCDCVMPEVEEVEALEEENMTEEQVTEEKPLIDLETMNKLLSSPEPPSTSQICDLATEELPCGVLKAERDKIIRRHEAATCIQAHWRGAWARKCMTDHLLITTDVMKMIMENAFGNLEALSALMNEFFLMYPGAKYAYSVASALSGVIGLHQYNGTSSITSKCKWIPYFQGVFYCHAPVKVHLDLQSSLPYCTVAVYDNDDGKQMPQVYNAHITFHFEPNDNGYTIMGHGTLNEPPDTSSEVNWQLTVLSSTADVFHICDNDIDSCKELYLPQSNKLHIDEVFIPNSRNILGGVQISVQRQEYVSFRAAATSPELEMEAILYSTSSEGVSQELGRCSGIGELYWPYIKLESANVTFSSRSVKIHSTANFSLVQRDAVFASARSLKTHKAGGKTKSTTKIKDVKPLEPKQYTIKVIAPNGWPLTLDQWTRVNEVRNMHEEEKLDIIASKKPMSKDRGGSAKDKVLALLYQPQPGDAYVELECSLAAGGGSQAKRDDERDLQFAAERKSWDMHEPGRNLRGSQIRKDFRAEFLEIALQPPSPSLRTVTEETYSELEGEQKSKQLISEDIRLSPNQQGPTPVTESEFLENMSTESEEETKYLTMPEQLKDKFIPLYYVPLCTKEIEEERVILTPQLLEEAQKTRHIDREAALQRMRDLQAYNETYVLGRQKHRCQLLEKLFVDSQWNPELSQVLEERDEAIAREALNRTLSAATKKKMEAKKK